MTSLFRGGPPNLTLSDKGEGVKNPQKRPDVIYGCPLCTNSTLYYYASYIGSAMGFIFSKYCGMLLPHKSYMPTYLLFDYVHTFLSTSLVGKVSELEIG